MSKAKSIFEKYIFIPRTFKILLIISLFIMQIPLMHYEYGEYIKYILFLGIAITFLKIINGKLLIKDSVSICLILFMLFYMVSILLNRDTFFVENLKQLVYMAVFFFVFFMLPDTEDRKDLLREIKVVSVVIVFVTFLLSLFSCLTYLLNISEWYYLNPSDPEAYYVGVLDKKLHGLYNSNICGFIAAISLMMSIYLLMDVKKYAKRNKVCVAFLIFNIFLEFLVLMMSQSRGAIYSCIIACYFLLFLLIIGRIRGKSTIKKIFVIILFLLLFVSSIIVTFFIQKNISKIVLVSEENSKNVAMDSEFENVIETVLNYYVENTSAQFGAVSSKLFSSIANGINWDNKDDISNGRFVQWRVGFIILKTQPLFGVTREGIVDKANEIFGYESTSVERGGLHSIYVTTLVSSGVVGFLTMLISVGIVIYKSLKVCFSKNVDLNYLCLYAIIIMFLVSELVESRILYQVNVFNVIFWIYFGYLYYFTRNYITN